MRKTCSPAGGIQNLRKKVLKKRDALWTTRGVTAALDRMNHGETPASFSDYIDVVLNWAWEHGGSEGPRSG